MNIADKMERESRLLANLVSWMETHGEVISDRSQSNSYVGVRIRTIRWHSRTYTAVDIDGMTCQLERNRQEETV
jgi:hypothetical protein